MKITAELTALLTLERSGETSFVGHSSFMGSPNVFGGQVVAQALHAAYNTVPEERICHSLHAYFILPGNLKKPIEYQVQLLRDGGSFTTRSVIAKQDDIPIFMMATSFQKPEHGHEHQIAMPEGISQPEELVDWIEITQKYQPFFSKHMLAFLGIDRPIEMRPCWIDDPAQPVESADYYVWFRFREVPENLDWKAVQQLLTYASDYNILTAALRMHGDSASLSNTQLASLDHAIWFHHETDLNDWLLFAITSPSSSGARGFSIGNIFTRSGKLIATVSQEGLMRPIPTRK